MISAVIYESNTGFTRRYAEMLAAGAGLPFYAVREASRHLAGGAEVAFLGWVCAGKLMGFEETERGYDVRMVCAVGMETPCAGTGEKIAGHNRISHIPVFYLPGGYDPRQIGMFYRMMMAVMISKLEHREMRTPEEERVLLLAREGGDLVEERYLADAAAYLREYNENEGVR